MRVNLKLKVILTVTLPFLKSHPRSHNIHIEISLRFDEISMRSMRFSMVT